MRILIADDDPGNLFVLSEILADHELTICRNGAEAIRALSPDYDLIITDYKMPEASGADVARAAERMGIDVPIAIKTTYDQDIGVVKDVARVPHFAFIEGGFSREKIAHMMERLRFKKRRDEQKKQTAIVQAVDMIQKSAMYFYTTAVESKQNLF